MANHRAEASPHSHSRAELDQFSCVIQNRNNWYPGCSNQQYVTPCLLPSTRGRISKTFKVTVYVQKPRPKPKPETRNQKPKRQNMYKRPLSLHISPLFNTTALRLSSAGRPPRSAHTPAGPRACSPCAAASCPCAGTTCRPAPRTHSRPPCSGTAASCGACR